MDEDEEKLDVSMDVEANETPASESINDIAKLKSSPEVVPACRSDPIIEHF